MKEDTYISEMTFKKYAKMAYSKKEEKK